MFHGADGSGQIIAVVHQLVEDVNAILKGCRNLDLVILDIGSKDLNKNSVYSPRHLVKVISDLVATLLGNCVMRVVVAGMFFHKGNAARCWDAAVDQNVKLAESLCLHCTHQFNKHSRMRA